MKTRMPLYPAAVSAAATAFLLLSQSSLGVNDGGSDDDRPIPESDEIVAGYDGKVYQGSMIRFV
jgi:hypothetical protein